jgi:ADP-heptose:LPS heptosyltransferase
VPNSEYVDKWRKRLADLGKGLKIGISWLAGKQAIQKKCSIPLQHWKNLLSIDAFFVNLQYGNTVAEVDQFTAENNIRIYDWEDNDALLDLDNQAALISNLDLVISVDNATVLLCIALGTKVWNLIDPSLNLMWMENGTGNSPLSPHVRFFKKKYQDSWGTVLNFAEGELREKINTQR